MNNLCRRSFLATAAFFLLLIPNASGADAPRRPTSTSEVWVRTELYFGTNKPDNTQVTDAEFNAFVDQQVTTRFPDGLTLLTGNGQFRSSTGVLIREKSQVLILFYPPQVLNANKLVQDIREAYKSAFSQESVLRVDSFSVVSF